ncbi:MAG: hypothetical protein ACQERB_15760 [Promethearchaeati archaeon]
MSKTIDYFLFLPKKSRISYKVLLDPSDNFYGILVLLETIIKIKIDSYAIHLIL